MKGVYLKKGNTRVSVVPYYRVGDLFLTTIATNPSNFLGGKWELFGPGRCLVCVNSSDSDFNTVKKTGGSKYMQSHYHELQYYINNGNNMPGGSDKFLAYGMPAGSTYYTSKAYPNVTTGNSGNLQPYITCYIWIRTA